MSSADMDQNDAYIDQVPHEKTLVDELVEQLRMAPALLISVCFHGLILLIMFLLPSDSRQQPRNRIIIQTSVDDPVEEEKEEEEIIEPVLTETTDPLEEVLTNTQTVVTTASTSVAPTVTTSIDIPTDVSIDIPVNDSVGDPTDTEVADAPADSAPSVIGISAGAFGSAGGTSASFRGGYGRLGKALQAGIRMGGGSRGSKGLIMVWLLDQSLSMKDDQQAVSRQASDIQELLTDGGRKSMVSAVVAYDIKPTTLQTPTRNASEISNVIANVPPPASGTENVGLAISYACKTIMEEYTGWTKVIVLLTDENGDDHKSLVPADLAGERKIQWQEYALQELYRTRTRLFVIGKESPFQASTVREKVVDSDGDAHMLPANRGPESAFIEVPMANTTQNYDYQSSRNLSGFGMWDLAYLARGSQGAYFILDESTESRRPLRPSEKASDPFRVDWGIMDDYKPLLISRSKYDEEVGKTAYGRTLIKLRNMMGGAPGRHWGQIHPPSNFGVSRDSTKKRLDIVRDALKVCQDGLVSEKVLAEAKNRRDIANLDLYYCALLADLIITESTYDAYERYKGPTPNDPTQTLMPTRLQGGELTPEKRERFDRNMARLNDAVSDVIRRHPNTPWANMARVCQGGPRSHGNPFDFIFQPYVQSKPGKQYKGLGI